MSDFSLLVRKKIEALNSEQKQMFDEEYNRRKKPFGDENNNELALDILRDISLTFGNVNPIQKNYDEEVKRKDFGDSTHLPPKKKSKGILNSFIILAVFVVFISVSSYTKPTKAKMENDIINKFLETQPKLLKFFKEVFLGEEISEEKADNIIYNFLKSNGYEIYFKDYDFVIAKKLEIVDKVSDKSLLTAYGFFGKAFITYKSDDLVIDFGKNENNYGNNFENTKKPKYQAIESDLKYEPKPLSSWDEEKKSSENEKIRNSLVEDNNKSSELESDSIKIN